MSEPVPIFHLISPLRYDIIVRWDYFKYFRDNRGLYDSDFLRYLHLAKELPYFYWFRDLACRHFAPHVLESRRALERALEHAFAERLCRNADLSDSYRRIGFDQNRPIRLWAGKEILPAGTGKNVVRRIYTGGGCHRIALLLLDGMTELPPQWVRVRICPTYRPCDSTNPLISSLRMSSSTYYRFLSLGYADGQVFDSRDALRAYIKQTDHDLLEELDHVLAIDEPKLQEVAQNLVRAFEGDGPRVKSPPC